MYLLLKNTCFFLLTVMPLKKKVNVKMTVWDKKSSFKLELSNVMVKNLTPIMGESGKEFEAKIKLWSRHAIAIFPAINAKRTKFETIKYKIKLMQTPFIESYDEPTPDSVVISMDNGQKYQFRFGAPQTKKKFINMFRITG